MSGNEVGEVRQSAVLMTYGPGAIIDFRLPTGAAASVVAGGLDFWEEQARESGAGVAEFRRLVEPRLAEKLKVQHFRLPPVAERRKAGEQSKGEGKEKDKGFPLIGVRFPDWLQCPGCGLLKRAGRWTSRPGDPSRACDQCSAKLKGDRSTYVVPVRFVTACRRGHLNEFPWSEWVHRGSRECSSRKFRLEQQGAGLAGLILRCEHRRCDANRTMEGVFSSDAMQGHLCGGGTPWLPKGREDCDEKCITMQRGASSLYFPIHTSALAIPPWSDDLVHLLGTRWARIRSYDTDEGRRQYIENDIWDDLDEHVRKVGFERFVDEVNRLVRNQHEATSGNLRWDEYKQFLQPGGFGRTRIPDFEVREEVIPESRVDVTRLARVVRLKEVRAFTGFTRVEASPGSRIPVFPQPAASSKKNWLPAVAVRGEGIFFTLDEVRVADWEQRPAVVLRASQVGSIASSRVLNPDFKREPTIKSELAARYLLLHSLAHVLMKQLSLQCGYSSASLRERIYAGDGDMGMAGIMIYTATADSDGTLGGLQRQGNADRFFPVLDEALRANRWCSSDPLCIKGLVAATEGSLAACHSCLMAPETSCEDYNRFLDRAMLVGTEKHPELGFFAR